MPRRIAVRAHRVLADVKQGALAQRLGTSPNYLSQIENGWRRPSDVMLIRIINLKDGLGERDGHGLQPLQDERFGGSRGTATRRVLDELFPRTATPPWVSR